MISFTVTGDFNNTEEWLKKMASADIFSALSKYGDIGRSALAAATPLDTGETANSWTYEILQESGSWSIIWGNTHIDDGRPIAILLQYGHGTGTGGYVVGRDYINPALQPLFDQMADEAWKVVTSA